MCPFWHMVSQSGVLALYYLTLQLFFESHSKKPYILDLFFCCCCKSWEIVQQAKKRSKMLFAKIRYKHLEILFFDTYKRSLKMAMDI